MTLQVYADRKRQEAREQDRSVRPRMFSDSELTDLVDGWQARWEQFHTPLHSLAYALDPEFFCCSDLLVDPDVSRDIATALEALYPDVVERGKIDAELMKLRVAYCTSDAFTNVAQMVSSHTIWATRYINTPLRPLAMRLLSQPVSSSSCERLWSNFDFVHSNLRYVHAVPR